MRHGHCRHPNVVQHRHRNHLSAVYPKSNDDGGALPRPLRRAWSGKEWNPLWPARAICLRWATNRSSALRNGISSCWLEASGFELGFDEKPSASLSCAELPCSVAAPQRRCRCPGCPCSQSFAVGFGTPSGALTLYDALEETKPTRAPAKLPSEERGHGQPKPHGRLCQRRTTNSRRRYAGPWHRRILRRAVSTWAASRCLSAQ